MLHRLRWEISAVTSHDFLDPLLHRLSLERYLPSSRVPDVRRQAQTFIVMCSTGESGRASTARADKGLYRAALISWVCCYGRWQRELKPFLVGRWKSKKKQELFKYETTCICMRIYHKVSLFLT